MIRNFISKVKSDFSIFRNLVFPPFCAICKEKCEAKLFCPTCWALCASPDPLEKCAHCFEDAEGLCRRCKRNPILTFPRAYVFESVSPALHLAEKRADLLAAFAICQWARLDWLLPDVVIAMPGMQKVAIDFAKRILRPFAHMIRYE